MRNTLGPYLTTLHTSKDEEDNYMCHYREPKGHQDWKIQRNWQHWVHKSQDENKQNKTKTMNKMDPTKNHVSHFNQIFIHNIIPVNR
jgi:hypothetical protein